MIYPNGYIKLNKLFDMVSSDDYDVFIETDHREKILDSKKLIEAIELEHNKKGKICYDFTTKYFEKNPDVGEELENNNVWKYNSLNGSKYIIKECSYITDKPEHPSWELAKFLSGEDFNGINYSIAVFDYDEKEEEYVFHSIGSRLFREVTNDIDISVIWKALMKASEFLNGKFLYLSK